MKSEPVSVLLLSCFLGCASPPAETLSPVEADLSRIDEESSRRVHELIAEVRSAPRDGERRAALGAAYEMNNMSRAAERSYEQATILEPGEARWHYYLAMARAQQGRFGAAVDALASAIDLDDTYVPAHVRHGGWQLELENLESARDAYEKALMLDRENEAAKIGLARVMLERGQAAEAVVALERLAPRRTDSYFHNLLASAYRQAGRVEQAAETLRRGAPREKPPLLDDPWHAAKAEFRTGLDARIDRAQKLLSARRYAEAIEALERLLEERPSKVGPVDALARTYERVGRVDDAFRLLHESLRTHPDNIDLLLSLGEMHRRQGQPDRALEPVRHVIELSPTHARAHSLLGGCLIDSGRVEQARAAYDEALRHAPWDAGAHYASGVISAGLGEWRLARDRLERAVEIDPDMGPAWLALAAARLETGDLDRAAAALERVRQLDPANPRLGEVERQLAAARGGNP